MSCTILSPPLRFIASDSPAGEHFSLDLSGTSHVNLSALTGLTDIGAFYNKKLLITRRMTGIFTSDLTDRDDVILAVLSLLLLLVIKGMFATVLLRTDKGRASRFSFATKQLIEMVEDFKFKPLSPGCRLAATPISKDTLLLVFAALSVLLLTFGLEVAVLFLTDPKLIPVTNKQVTFRILGPVTPRWGSVRFHMRVSLNRPCTSMNLLTVDQGETKINACIDSDLPSSTFELFSPTTDVVDMKITSTLHDYGQDHEVSIGNMSASFVARVYFSLQDGVPRLMRQKIGMSASETRTQMMIVHNMYLAYLFSSYRGATMDASASVERLNGIENKFCSRRGAAKKITQMDGKGIFSSSTVYESRFRGVIPHGSAAMRLGQSLFKASIVVGVSEGDEEDLVDKKGVYRKMSTVWSERARTINWVSLSMVLGFAVVMLVFLRYWLKPTSTIELAERFVKEAVGADMMRSAVQVGREEKRRFAVDGSVAGWLSGESLRDERLVAGMDSSTAGVLEEYQLGAETDGNWKAKATEEYVSTASSDTVT